MIFGSGSRSGGLLGLPLALVAVLVGTWVIGSFAAAVYSRDPHLFQRSGAALLVVGALLIFWQLRIDHAIERRLEEARRLQSASSELPSDRIAVEIAHSRGERLVSNASVTRDRLVMYLAAVTATGEAIHGFGDLVVELVLPVCGQ
jgi:hypothetical protein